jgi:hypothetical protein
VLSVFAREITIMNKKRISFFFLPLVFLVLFLSISCAYAQEVILVGNSDDAEEGAVRYDRSRDQLQFSDDGLYFVAFCSSQSQFAADGSLGINTLTPSYTLAVNGDASVSTSLTVDSLFVGSTEISSDGQWTDTGSILHPTDSTADEIVIGGTNEAGADIFLGVDGTAVFNEQGAAVDFKVEGDTEQNLLYVDGSENYIGIGTNTPQTLLEVDGNLSVTTDLSAGNIIYFGSEGAIRDNGSGDVEYSEDGGSTWTDFATASGEWTDAGSYLIPSDASEDVQIDGNLSVNNNVSIANNLSVNNYLQLDVAAGTHGATDPTIAFGDGDTGFYESADDTLVVVINGSQKYNFNESYLQSTSSNGFYLLQGDPSSTTTSYTFSGDANTGIGRNTADSLALIAGGQNIMNLSESGSGSGGVVGIGTQSPEMTLDVSGDVSVANNISIANNLSTGNIIYFGVNGGIRDNGGGDVEFTEDGGSTWTDMASGSGEWSDDGATLTTVDANRSAQIDGELTLTGGMAVAYVAKTGDYTADANDYFIAADGSSGTVTITLPPAASGAGKVFIIKAVDVTNAVDVDGAGSETIDGNATYTFSAQYESIAVISNGTNWYIMYESNMPSS